MGLGTAKQLSVRSARRRTLLAIEPPSGRSPSHPRAPLEAAFLNAKIVEYASLQL